MSSSSATTETQVASESDKAPKWAQEDGGVELMYLRATAAWSKIGQMCFESEMSPAQKPQNWQGRQFEYCDCMRSCCNRRSQTFT